MQQKTYAELFELISALAGVSDFATEEESQILAMANRRLYQAYRASSTWPRYVVGGEARLASEGLISRSFTPSTQSISSATRSGTTVTCTLAATPNFVAGMTVTIASLSGTEDPNGSQVVTGINDLTFTFELDSGTGTETYSGSGTVTAAAQSDIDSFIRIFGTNPLGQLSAREYDFYVDVDGAHVINAPSDKNDYWVTYVKEWPGPYLDTATDIPLEFFYYAAHATYADYLRLDRQNDKAQSEEAVAQQYLVLELDKAQNQSNNNTLFRRIQTHLSRQSR